MPDHPAAPIGENLSVRRCEHCDELVASEDGATWQHAVMFTAASLEAAERRHLP